MRASTASATAGAAIVLIAAGVLFAACGGATADDGSNQRESALATATARRSAQASFDLGSEALALLPNGTKVSDGQTTRARRCLDDGEYEPCAEFSVDASGPGTDRRGPFERRARQRGWRIVSFETEKNGATLLLERGRLRARIMLTSYGFDRIRVWDPTRRRPVVEDVEINPVSVPAARAPFVAAAESACRRFKARVKSVRVSDPRALRAVVLALERFVDEIVRLRVPSGDQRAVRRLRRELQNYANVLHMLEAAENEQALAATTAIVIQGNRAEDAMQQYGLHACKGITGVPKM